MPIEVQRRTPRSRNLARCLNWLAPQGWNTNTQFFLVFLGVLCLHLWMAPFLMRSAATVDPGEPQGYFTSHGGGAADAPKNRATSVPTPPKPSVPAEMQEPLVLTDPSSKAPATPVAEADPAEDEKIADPDPAVPAPGTTVAETSAARPAAPGEADDSPRLSDLIAEAPSATKDPAEEVSRPSAPAPARSTPESEGRRQFRQLR